MSLLRHHPVGARIPGSQHSVVVSLPTMADVIGYEERHPDTMRAVQTGYPRFIRHPFLLAAATHAAQAAGLQNRATLPVASVAAARQVAQFLPSAATQILPVDDWALLHFPAEETLVAQAGKLIQHLGVTLPTRQAESWLVAQGKLPQCEEEEIFSGDSSDHIRQALAPLLAPAAPDDIFLCNSGMNAVYAAFEAVRAAQRPRGRNVWLQLGWLYTDTTAIFQKCLGTEEIFLLQENGLDRAALEKIFAEHGDRLAGIITEAPTNPLLQTADLPWLAATARRHGALCIIDPSSTGLVNVDVMPFADLVVTSLTKYAGHCGDILLGAIAANPASPDFLALQAALRQLHTPAHTRDLARLAAQIDSMPTVAAQINANTLRLAAWLEKHPAVRRVHWAHSHANAAHYAAIARTPQSPGCMISFELKNLPPARFYDRLQAAKGPSFGTDFTLVSPFIYLAHYDLVREPDSRRYLLNCGIDPELMRVSVGTEPYAQIEAAFSAALQ